MRFPVSASWACLRPSVAWRASGVPADMGHLEPHRYESSTRRPAPIGAVLAPSGQAEPGRAEPFIRAEEAVWRPYRRGLSPAEAVRGGAGRATSAESRDGARSAAFADAGPTTPPAGPPRTPPSPHPDDERGNAECTLGSPRSTLDPHRGRRSLNHPAIINGQPARLAVGRRGALRARCPSMCSQSRLVFSGGPAPPLADALPRSRFADSAGCCVTLPGGLALLLSSRDASVQKRPILTPRYS